MMDDYTLQQELEALAGNAFTTEEKGEKKPEPIRTTMDRWQSFLKLSPDDAVERFMGHRDNLTRTWMSDAHWDTVRSDEEAKGYDREAYAYELELQKKKAILPDLVPSENGTASVIKYLVELTGPLSTAEKAQHAGGLRDLPTEVVGYGTENGRPVTLCCIDSDAQALILKWASFEGAGYEPTILVDPRSLHQ